MASDIPIVTLGEVAASISETHHFGKEELIFLNTSDLLRGKFLHQKYSSVKDMPGQAKKSIQKDDILFSEIRPANGRWAFVDKESDDYVVSTKLMVIRTNPERLVAKYLYLFLTSAETTQWLQQLAEARSGTFPQITFDQVAALEIRLPPIEEQRRIVEAIGALDDLVEVNRHLAASLEESLAMQFSRLHFDTAGSTAVRLQDLVEVNPSRPKPSGEATYIDMAALPMETARVSEVSRRKAMGGARFQNGDTLVARITPCLENGKTAFIDLLGEGEVAVGSTEFIVLQPRDPLPACWAYFLARSSRFRDYAIRHMTGTSGRQRCSAQALAVYPIDAPPPVAVIRFSKVAVPAMTAIRNLDDEAATARDTRDALLPLLLSGAVTVREVAA
jgi:type I restriction enzyme S subunit